MPDGDADSLSRPLTLVEMLLSRYARRGDESDLQKAIDQTEQIRSLMEDINLSHANFGSFLGVFANVSIHRFKATGAVSFLNAAISQLEGSFDTIQEDPVLLHLYAITLLRRFEKLDSIHDLKMAIQNAERVVSISTASHLQADLETCLRALSDLSEMYGLLYEYEPHNGARNLDLGVEKGLEAVQLIPEEMENFPEMALMYEHLSMAFSRRYCITEREDDLSSAINYGQISLRLAGRGGPYKSTSIANIGMCFGIRFNVTGKLQDLDLATEKIEQSIAMTTYGTKEMLWRSKSLAEQLIQRFDWTGETEALNLAIEKLEVVLADQDRTNVERAKALRTQAAAFLKRFDRVWDVGDLEKAIQKLRESRDAYPVGYVDIPHVLSYLCLALSLRYSQSKQESDIVEAINSGIKAQDLLTKDTYARQSCLMSISSAYHEKFVKTRDEADLDEAVKYSLASINTTLSSQTDWVVRYCNHANLIIERAFMQNAAGDNKDFNEALQHYKMVAESSNVFPIVRLVAARNAMYILMENEDWEDAKSMGLAAMELLSLVCSRYLAWQNQQQVITEISGLAADLCSILLQMGQPEEALFQLEAGRCVLFGYMVDNQGDLQALESDSLELAVEYVTLRNNLRLPPDLHPSKLGEAKIRERRAAEAAMSDCLQKIRSIPGHKNFLQAPSIPELMTGANEGPIVLVNVTRIRSDAILVLRTNLRSIQLPELKFEGPSNFAPSSNISRGLSFFRRGSTFERESKLMLRIGTNSSGDNNFLESLWNYCVKPIFDELKIPKNVTTEKELPRIWWIGSGAATSYPFHAARSSSEDKQDSLSLTIPSYALSIKTLLYSRKCSKEYRNLWYQKLDTQLAVTVVTMSTTPGQKPLPGASKECAAIETICDGAFHFTELPQPCVKQVLQEILRSDIMHFACHGVANIDNLSMSHFLLQTSGENDSPAEVEELPFSKILGLDKLRGAWIAYLSACTTAASRASRLADEGLHMSGAMQAAGFSHTIGSLWPVEDDVCVQVANHFYKNLLARRSLFPDDRVVAVALRNAILEVRDQIGCDGQTWRKWAAYIHSGA